MKDMTTDKKQIQNEKKEMNKEFRRRAPVYAAISALLTLIGLFGLFIGYYTGNSHLGYVLAGGAPILRGSLIGIILEIIRGSIPMPNIFPLTYLHSVFPLFLYFAVLFLVAALLISVLMTIAAILLPNASRKLCLRVGKLLLFAYTALFIGNFLFRAFSSEYFDVSFFDVPSAISVVLLLAVLFFLSVSENRARGALNFSLFLLSAFMLLGLCLPGSPIARDVNELLFLNGAHGGSARLMLLLLCICTVCNFLFSLLRLNLKRGFFFDFLRFGGQIACEVFLILEYKTLYGSATAFFTIQPLPAVLLLCGSGLGFFLSLFEAALTGRKSRAKAFAKASKDEGSALKHEKRRSASPDFDEKPSSRGAV